MMSARTVVMLAGLLSVVACTCVDTVPPPLPAASVPAATVPEPAAAAKPEEDETKQTAMPAPLVDTPPGVTRCELNDDVRLISLREEKDHWVVVYENDGVARAIPGRGGTLADAKRLSERLKKNLVHSGFKCE